MTRTRKETEEIVSVSDRYYYLTSMILGLAKSIRAASSISAIEEQAIYNREIRKSYLHIMDYRIDPYDEDLIREWLTAGRIMPKINFETALTFSRQYPGLDMGKEEIVSSLCLMTQQELIIYRRSWRYFFKSLIFTTVKSKRG